MTEAMKKLIGDAVKLDVFSLHCKYLDYTANLDDVDAAKDDFMHHAVQSLNKLLMSNFKCLNQLDVNPVTENVEKVKQHKKKPGCRFLTLTN